MNNCKRCGHLCHCNKNDEHRIVVDCECIGCNCPKANVWHYESPKDKANDLSFENNGVVINDSNECEGCQ
jgi:hypothetical protein